MKTISIALMSVALLLTATANAFTDDCCNGGSCCKSQACCRSHQK